MTHLHGRRISFRAEERTLVQLTPDVVWSYRQVVRLVSALVVTPLSLLALVAAILSLGLNAVVVLSSFSLVYVLVLLGLLAVTDALEDRVTGMLVAAIWPVHRYWLVKRHPDRLRLTTERRVTRVSTAVTVWVCPRAGVLRVGEERFDLTGGLSVVAERAEGKRRELRLRMGGRTTFAATLPSTVFAEIGTDAWEGLPRLEGAAIQLDWFSFCRLTTALRQIDRASAGVFPDVLKRVTFLPSL